MERGTSAAPGPSTGVVDLWGAVKRNRVRLGAAVLLAGTITFGLLAQVTPLHLATSVISIAADGAGDVDLLAVAARARSPQTQAGVIAALTPDQRRSLDPSQHVPRRLDPLVARLAVGARARVDEGLEEPERLGLALSHGLLVTAQASTGTLRIGFIGREPQLAASLANAIAEALVEQSGGATLRSSVAAVPAPVATNAPAIAALEAEIGGLEREIATAEVELATATTARRQAGLALERAPASVPVPAVPTSTATPRLRGTAEEAEQAATSAEIGAARAASRAMAERIKRLSAMLQDGTAQASPEALRSPVVRRLIAQRLAAEEKVSELAVTLLARHPRMQQANAELEGVRRQINEEIRSLQRAMESELAGLVARQKVLEEEARLIPAKPAPQAATQFEAASASGAQAGPGAGAAERDDPSGRLAVMDAEIALKQRALAELGERRAALESRLAGLRLAPLAEAEGAGARAAAEVMPGGARVSIIARADPATSAVLPRKAAWALLAMALALLIGLGAVVMTVREAGRAARRMRRGPMEARGEPGAPSAIAPEPRAGGKVRAANGDEVAGAALAPARRSALEAGDRRSQANAGAITLDDFAYVVGQIDRLASEGPGLRVVVSGMEQSTDGTSEAVGLAVASARSGRQSLVVGWGAAGEVLARRLGVSAAPGIHEILEGSIGFEEALCVDPRSGLFILVMGGSAGAKAATYQREQIEMLFDALDESFDSITILAGHDSGRRLLEALDGRIDVGVFVVDERRRGGKHLEGGFLGYEVPELPVFRVAAGSGRALVPSDERELLAS